MSSKPSSSNSPPAGTIRHGFAQDGLSIPTMVKPASVPSAPLPTTTATAPAPTAPQGTGNK